MTPRYNFLNDSVDYRVNDSIRLYIRERVQSIAWNSVSDTFWESVWLRLAIDIHDLVCVSTMENSQEFIHKLIKERVCAESLKSI